MTKKLQVTDKPTTEILDTEVEDFQIGQWFWVAPTPDDVEDAETWLACITQVGSNYVMLEGVGGAYQRIHFDDFDKYCTRERDPDAVISGKVGFHREAVRVLLNKVKQLTAKLGITRSALAEENEGPSTALAVASGVKNIKAHKKALIKAKEKTLPELFERVKEEHEEMARWMKAQLIPLEAETSVLKTSTKVIKDRIFTVELYAGLIEELVQIRDGEPAPNDTKVSLFQRRHYMDEECLAYYEAGGMDYKSVEEFDEWLLKKGNRERILPSERCVVAFRIRRHRKERTAKSLLDFITFFYEEQADEQTYLYIRNGEQYFRMTTGIDFGERFFPDRSQSTLLGNERLWAKISVGSVDEVITQREYAHRQDAAAERRAEWVVEMAAWKKKQAKKKKPDDIFWAPNEPDRFNFFDKYVECTPSSVYYDDVMKKIARAAIEHNRVAVVLQGLLDRSPAFHPHPPWQLWTSEGFLHGIELIYDDSRVLVPGDAPDFKAYRAELGKTLKRGSMTIGQEIAWEMAEAAKENDRDRYGDRMYTPTRVRPYGNPGPGTVAKVASFGRTGKCTFEWERERLTYKRYGPDTPIKTRFTCPGHILLNVDAYKAGDFKIFYDDHRTRADYLQWAPLLLAAEDYVGRKKKKKKK